MQGNRLCNESIYSVEFRFIGYRRRSLTDDILTSRIQSLREAMFSVLSVCSQRVEFYYISDRTLTTAGPIVSWDRTPLQSKAVGLQLKDFLVENSSGFLDKKWQDWILDRPLRFPEPLSIASCTVDTPFLSRWRWRISTRTTVGWTEQM